MDCAGTEEEPSWRDIDVQPLKHYFMHLTCDYKNNTIQCSFELFAVNFKS